MAQVRHGKAADHRAEPRTGRAPERSAATAGSAAAVHPVLALQARLGNQAATRFVQAKLRVGPPGDVYEQEADRVADAVMRMPEDGSIRPVQQQSIHALQAKCAECEKEEREGAALQRASSAEQRGPLNPHEEDDRGEGSSPSPVVRRQLAVEPLAKRQAAEEPEEEEPGALMAQRQETEGDEEGEAVQPSIQRETARGVLAVSPRMEATIAGAHGGGYPLPEASRSFFEPRFGADFSAIRVHSGSTSASTSRELGARAFTVGTDIFFGEGQYRPASASGGRLLAHELTHVIQQGGGRDDQATRNTEIQGSSAVGIPQQYVQLQRGTRHRQAASRVSTTAEQLRLRHV